MAVLLVLASALAPPESDFFCLLASAFRSNKKELENFLSRVLLVVCGKVGICATVPETKVFFPSHIWGNCCPEKSSHFLSITELTKWQSRGPLSRCCTQCSSTLQGSRLWLCVSVTCQLGLSFILAWEVPAPRVGLWQPQSWAGSFWKPWVPFQPGSLGWLP